MIFQSNGLPGPEGVGYWILDRFISVFPHQVEDLVYCSSKRGLFPPTTERCGYRVDECHHPDGVSCDHTVPYARQGGLK